MSFLEYHFLPQSDFLVGENWSWQIKAVLDIFVVKLHWLCSCRAEIHRIIKAERDLYGHLVELQPSPPCPLCPSVFPSWCHGILPGEGIKSLTLLLKFSGHEGWTRSQLLVGLNRLGAFTLKKCPSREKFKLCPRWRAPNKMLPWFLVLERPCFLTLGPSTWSFLLSEVLLSTKSQTQHPNVYGM